MACGTYCTGVVEEKKDSKVCSLYWHATIHDFRSLKMSCTGALVYLCISVQNKLPSLYEKVVLFHGIIPGTWMKHPGLTLEARVMTST